MNAFWRREKRKLALEPQTHIARPLSFFEYGHAAAGASGKTLEPPRIITMVLEGESTLAPRQWEEALRRVVDANHGVPLRIHGARQRARWTRDGALPPQLRSSEDGQWARRSQPGMDTSRQ